MYMSVAEECGDAKRRREAGLRLLTTTAVGYTHDSLAPALLVGCHAYMPYMPYIPYLPYLPKPAGTAVGRCSQALSASASNTNAFPVHVCIDASVYVYLFLCRRLCRCLCRRLCRCLCHCLCVCLCRYILVCSITPWHGAGGNCPMCKTRLPPQLLRLFFEPRQAPGGSIERSSKSCPTSPLGSEAGGEKGTAESQPVSAEVTGLRRELASTKKVWYTYQLFGIQYFFVILPLSLHMHGFLVS